MIDPYDRQYVELDFERQGLFELLKRRYEPREVLYPGCSVHITPAFFFPHLVFVDQDPQAAAFFADREAVLQRIYRQRRYPRSPFVQFLAQDFTQPLPIPENQFDLLLALYTGGVSKACTRYLKTGGLLLTNNHQNDALDAMRDEKLTWIGAIHKRKGKYHFLDAAETRPPGSRSPSRKSKSDLRQTSRGLAYVDREYYDLFRRTA